jgi:hypothetical protein
MPESADNSCASPQPSVGTSTEFRELPEGTRIELHTGAIAEVIGNPGDGGWLLVRILESPSDPSEVDSEEMVFFTDVKGAR